MCTASWLITGTGYELFFNRDEALTRGRSSGPVPALVNGVRCLAPVDADAGGTWLGVNEFGLAVGLLNAWDARAALGEVRSRGLLVRELLAARGFEELDETLRASALERHRAFTLVAFLPGREPRVLAWDGGTLAPAEARLPLCSSSLDRQRAFALRSEVLERLRAAHGRLDREVLELFQSSHEPERGPFSPCMHREDAGTVSASQVRVEAERISFRYAPGPPCSTTWEPPVRLARRGD